MMIWLFAMYVRGKRIPDSKFRNVFRVKIACNSIRTVSQAFVSSNKQAVYDGRVELDTHADTFVAGRNCLLMHFTERVCDVMPYSDEYEAKRGVPIVQVATAYTAANE